MTKGKRKRKHFLNDKDGLSAKDYLLLSSTTVFFAFVIIGLVMAACNRPLDPMYLSLLEMVAPVVMTVVAGVMGVQAVESFRRPDEIGPEETIENGESAEYEG